MVKMTVSFAKGKKSETSISHNNRSIEKDFDYDNKGHQHIKQEFTSLNEVLVHENIKDIYEQEFGDAVREYNQKQKRKDRKIKDYYSKVKHSKNMRTQYEFIVQVGNKDNFDHLKDRKNNDLWQDSKKILEQYFDGFQKRNPNLKVYNAAIHMDEQGAPHMHLNVVPVAHMPNAKRGLKVKPSFNQALAEEGFKIDKQDNRKQFRDFQHREADALSEIAYRFGIDRQKGIVNRLKDVHEYKQAQQMISQARDVQLKQINQQLSEADQLLDSKRSELRQITFEVDEQNSRKKQLLEENQRLEAKKIMQEQEIQRRQEKAKEDEILRQRVLAKQDQEIAEKKKLLEKLEEKLKATKDRATEMAKHVATSLKELSSNAASVFMKKFGELETTSQLERGVDKYDVEFPELEEAGFDWDQEEAFSDGADIAKESYDQQNSKSVDVDEPVETERDKPKKSLEEQYRQYLQSQGLDR